MNYRLWIWWLTWMITLSYLLIGISSFGQFVVLVSIFTSNFARKNFFCYDMLGDYYFWLNFFTNWKWKFIQLKEDLVHSLSLYFHRCKYKFYWDYALRLMLCSKNINICFFVAYVVMNSWSSWKKRIICQF